MGFQQEKKLVLDYFEAMEQAAPDQCAQVLKRFVADEASYDFKACYPVRQQFGVEAAAEALWKPLKTALHNMQRRQDVFFAGRNELDPDEVWVMSMGNFLGNFFDNLWNIRKTNKINLLRYAEFNCVKYGKIIKTGLFFDAMAFMGRAGFFPIPNSERANFVYPGPRGHNGLLFEDADEAAGAKTLKLIDDMITGVVPYKEGEDVMPEEGVHEHYWTQDMAWYGTMGSSFTIPVFFGGQKDFRGALKDREFVNHQARFAEGEFGAFFGWPNLKNTNAGGYLGLPGTNMPAEMQVVDVYCRVGDKLSENWVLIDMPWWLKMQGLDVFERAKLIMNT